MLYDDYLLKISKKFESRFSEIDPVWNFDQGNEFEVVLATTLDELLPDKYGVCRGFVVTQEGNKRGDDIIIYDKLAAPLLRPKIEERFTRKEEVPIEAVYAYIEAKNTLELEDKSVGTYIGKAIEQVKEVKSLPRSRRELSELIDGVSLDSNTFRIPQAENLPSILNPIYSMVVSRGVRIRGNLSNDPKEIDQAMSDFGTWGIGPDLFILSKNIVNLPVVEIEASDGGVKYYGPFVIDGKNDKFVSLVMDSYAMGFGVASLLYALQKIQLSPMPWNKVMFDGVVNSHLVVHEDID